MASLTYLMLIFKRVQRRQKQTHPNMNVTMTIIIRYNMIWCRVKIVVILLSRNLPAALGWLEERSCCFDFLLLHLRPSKEVTPPGSDGALTRASGSCELSEHSSSSVSLGRERTGGRWWWCGSRCAASPCTAAYWRSRTGSSARWFSPWKNQITNTDYKCQFQIQNPNTNYKYI